MSRPISRQSHAIQKNNAIWGSVSKERMVKFKKKRSTVVKKIIEQSVCNICRISRGC